jgi:hypothetical protein
MNILEAIEAQETRASASGELNDSRQDALDLYMGEPYGDEVEGRSQIVMRDVADTIEWIKPSLLKIFCAGDEVVRFDPVGPEDEEAAQQETDYCNNEVMQKNNGFMVFHDWFHDALLQKNGYVVVRPSKKRDAQKERFQGLTDDEFQVLMQSPDIKLEEHSEYVVSDPTTSMAPPVKYHNCVVEQAREYTCLEIVNIPPERVLVDSAWGGLSLLECPFVEVIDYKTISQLRNEGYDVEDTINDDSKYSEDDDGRDQLVGIDESDEDETGPTRSVKVRYVWIRHDSDEDGIAELRRVVVVGSTILEDEEDDIVPVAAISPIRMPHEHVGLSIADIVEDLQRIRTVLIRGFLDNTYLAMHGRHAIDVNRVNLSDMLTSRPGGIVRVSGDPGTAVVPMQQVNNGAGILQGVEYIDTVRENRTGVTKYNQGLDSDTLNKTATGMTQIMSASQQRIELIARMFAETGVKALMLIVHALSIKHGRQAQMLKLRGKWVPVDPRGWKTRKDLTVSVGIGTGNKDQMLQHLMMILQEQKQAMAIGLATPQNLYNSLKRITQNAGFKQAEEFWTDASQQPTQPPSPPPEIVKTQMQIQADQAESQAKRQDDAMRFQAEQQMQIAVDQNRQEWEAKQKQLELQQTGQLEAMKAQYEDMQQARELEFKRWFAEYDRETKLILAGIQAQQAQQQAEQQPTQ